jgi:putative transposase
MRNLVNDWENFLAIYNDDQHTDQIRCAQRTGRPLGTPTFINQLEGALGRRLRKGKPGPKAAIK